MCRAPRFEGVAAGSKRGSRVARDGDSRRARIDRAAHVGKHGGRPRGSEDGGQRVAKPAPSKADRGQGLTGGRVGAYKRTYDQKSHAESTREHDVEGG